MVELVGVAKVARDSISPVMLVLLPITYSIVGGGFLGKLYIGITMWGPRKLPLEKDEIPCVQKR